VHQQDALSIQERHHYTNTRMADSTACDNVPCSRTQDELSIHDPTQLVCMLRRAQLALSIPCHSNRLSFPFCPSRAKDQLSTVRSAKSFTPHRTCTKRSLACMLCRQPFLGCCAHNNIPFREKLAQCDKPLGAPMLSKMYAFMHLTSAVLAIVTSLGVPIGSP
jgi:hypothetical protein